MTEIRQIVVVALQRHQFVLMHPEPPSRVRNSGAIILCWWICSHHFVSVASGTLPGVTNLCWSLWGEQFLLVGAGL